MQDNFKKNVPNWKPTKGDYCLVFFYVDGYWREISNNIAEYSNMIFADYLSEIGISLPDDCQFCRIVREEEMYEFRLYGGKIRVSYHWR